MEKQSQTPDPPSYNISTIPPIQDQNPPAISEKQSPTTPTYHMTATPPTQNPYIQPVGTPQASINSRQLSSTPQPFNQFPPPQPLSNTQLGASPPRISTAPTANYQTPTMTTSNFQTAAMIPQPQMAQAAQPQMAQAAQPQMAQAAQPQMAQAAQPQFASAQQLGSVPQQFGAVPQQPSGIQPQFTGFQQPPALQQQYSGFQQQQIGYQQHPGFQQQPQMGAPAPSQQFYSATPLRLLGQGSAPVDCPVCRQRQMTQITMEAGNTTHAWAIGFCVVFCLGCIPYLMTGLMDVRHNCGSCGALLATWHRSGRIVVHAHA